MAGKKRKKAEKSKSDTKPAAAKEDFFSRLKGNFIEKKITALEDSTNYKLKQMEDSFTVMKTTLEGLKKENETLKKDKQFLLEKMKNYLVEEEKTKLPENLLAEKTEVSARDMPLRTEAADSSMKTPLDALLELVMKKGKVNFSEAAKLFHVKEKQIEEWARILEDHNLIEMHYPAMGKPVMKKIIIPQKS